MRGFRHGFDRDFTVRVCVPFVDQRHLFLRLCATFVPLLNRQHT